MNTYRQAVAFKALLGGVEALHRGFDRIGHQHHGFRLMIPSALGERIELELLSMPRDGWMSVCDGITLYADGALKQIVLYESMWVGWKTGPIRKTRKARKNGKPHSKTGNRR
jgi:hypothetical protein